MFSPLDRDHKFSHGFQIEYLRRRYRLEWAHLFVGYGYDVETGFAPRKDYLLLSPEVEYLAFPSRGPVNEHSVSIDTRFFLEAGKDPENTVVDNFNLSERQTEATWQMRFKNTSRLGFTLSEIDLTLLKDFDPTRLQDDDIFLPAGSKYHYAFLEGSYSSDGRKIFSYDIEPNFGSYFNGYRGGLGGSLNYRMQPYGLLGVAASYNFIEMDQPFEPVSTWLVGPRFDITFSKEVFFSTLVQYNSQRERFLVNSRFQWRFQPVSDFFIVYTDDYYSEGLGQFDSFPTALEG